MSTGRSMNKSIANPQPKENTRWPTLSNPVDLQQ